MSLLIGLLTFILVMTCLLLILLVLVQLPKKEAGAGLAFGAGAVDTLIGAGSGNALTKMTKYAAGVFLGLSVVLAMLNAQRHDRSTLGLQEALSRKASATPVLPTAAPAAAPSTGTLNTNPAAVTPGTAQPAGTPTLNLTPQSPASANQSTPASGTTPAQTQPQP